jgi:putrescine aminotransferase
MCTATASDTLLYESYGRLVSPSYPSFLKRLGLTCGVVRAEGATITDSSGKTYIDCVAGYGVFNLGHNCAAIIDAVIDQLNQKSLTTRPFISDIQVGFAELLSSIAPGELSCSFLLNSGSEAIDCAIKLVRLAKGRPGIITAQGSFHGHTLGALSACGTPSFKRAFEPLIPGFVTVPYGDVGAIERSMSEATAAVLIEPVQHEPGVVLPPDGYLRAVQDLCSRHDLLFVLDEVKTGMGKTGRLFACEHHDVEPDILCLGKSLGAGIVPVGAVVAKPELWRRFGLSFPMSASSYAENTLACRVGIEVIHCLEHDDLVRQCAEKGVFLMEHLRRCCTKYRHVLRTVSGLGLLVGLECVSANIALNLLREMIRAGVLVMTAFGNPSVIMIEPPLVISTEQLGRVIHALDCACELAGAGSPQEL